MKKDFTLHGVTVAFTTNEGIRPVLIELELEIQAGEWLAVVGLNGSGKSTLGKVLAGLCPISRGTVERGGEGAAHETSVQMVFQNPEAQIVGETVYEDVCFGLENLAVDPAEMPGRAAAALLLVGLEQKMHMSVEKLSGGQKQLLGIAGCLAMEARAIVFDEATAMLDPASREHVLRVVEELHRRGKTIIWITQWMEELAYADRVVALDAGKIAFNGSNREFFYGTGGESNPCEQLGFVQPYAVQVAQELQKQGVTLVEQPILPNELSKAVSEVCR
ncbi:MAG: ATP-binding cassette domain-containing protein [Tumebacillaceae bacterium]